MLFASLQPLQFKCTHFASAILFNINCNFAITIAVILSSFFVCVFCSMQDETFVVDYAATLPSLISDALEVACSYVFTG